MNGPYMLLAIDNALGEREREVARAEQVARLYLGARKAEPRRGRPAVEWLRRLATRPARPLVEPQCCLLAA